MLYRLHRKQGCLDLFSKILEEDIRKGNLETHQLQTRGICQDSGSWLSGIRKLRMALWATLILRRRD